MPWSKSLEPIFFGLDIEKNLYRIKKKKFVINMTYHQIKEANKTLRDYAMPSINGAHIYYKEACYTSWKFWEGLSQKNPNVHIPKFLEICNTFKHNRVTDDTFCLRLFPFSLKDHWAQILRSMLKQLHWEMRKKLSSQK